MFIPSGRTWIIVYRHCRDTTSRGDISPITKAGVDEKTARFLAERLNNEDHEHNYFAMRYSDY